MKKDTPGLITIQKFIYLLNDFYFNEFSAYLASINATLPLKLALAIRNRIPQFDNHEQLCKKIYGSFEKGRKQNFNQLASYTLRLSSVLAQNYPDYLRSNIFKIQQLVNEGKGEHANFLADVLLDVAERTEDFQCQIFVINFLSQQAYIIKDSNTGLKFDAKLNETLGKEKIFVDIQLFTRKMLGQVKLQKKELAHCKEYLLGFINNSSAAIRILSRHSYLLILYQFDLMSFEQPETVLIVEQLEKDLHNQAHIVFPYLLDLRNSLFFMKLNSTLKDLNSKESEREFIELSEHFNAIKYWKTFVNMGQLYLITIQCTRLFGKYEKLIYRSGYAEAITELDKKVITDCIGKCKGLLHSNIDVVKYEYEIMSHRILCGAFLILSGGANINEGIKELEAVLRDYTHLNLNTETDSIFMCIMLGYFAIKDYKQCIRVFKQFTKNIKDKPVFEENDLRIKALYFAAQWLLSNREQYAVELSKLLAENKKTGAAKTVAEVVEYFDIPCSLAV